jgi:hypothetical protein
VTLSSRLGVVRRGNALDEGRVHGDVRVRLLAGHELELVDHPFVVRIGHGQKKPIPAHQDRQDSVCLGHFARHRIEVFQRDRDLRQIDSRHAVLFRQGPQCFDLVELALAHQLGREWLGHRGSPLRLQRLIQLLLGDELALEEDLAERPLLVAGHCVIALR